MNSYNTPPVQPSIELKELVKNTLNLTEAGLINVFSQFDNHCFETLNDAVKYVEFFNTNDGWRQAHCCVDLQDFINEVRA
jgi:hypothetical protein